MGDPWEHRVLFTYQDSEFYSDITSTTPGPVRTTTMTSRQSILDAFLDREGQDWQEAYLGERNSTSTLLNKAGRIIGEYRGPDQSVPAPNFSADDHPSYVTCITL